MKRTTLIRIGGLLTGVIFVVTGVWAVSRFAFTGNVKETGSHNAATTAPNQTPDNGTPSDSMSATPIYTPSQQVASNGTTASYTSPSPSYTVINFYGEQLSVNGWKITSETTLNGTTTINAQGNGYTVSVAISDAANNSTRFTLQTS